VALIVIGSDVGSCLAAHEFRKLIRREEVVLAAESSRLGFSRTLLPYWAVGLVKSPIAVSRNMISIVDLVKVVPARSVRLAKDGKVEIDGKIYDNSRVLVSLWPELRRNGVIDLLTPEDAELLRERLERARKVVVVGGFTALPVVDAMLRAGVEVQLVWNADGFDEDFASLIADDLRKRGVKIVAEVPHPEPDSVVVNYGFGNPPYIPSLGLGGTKVRVDWRCRVAGCSRDIYAIGLATEVIEPEKLVHTVGSEEEVLLQALNFASSVAGARAPALRRYLAVRLGNTVYASLGLTQREAEEHRLEWTATRIRGWGAQKDTLVKAIASRRGELIGVQVATESEKSTIIGLLYFAVLTRARLLEASRALCPIDPLPPSFSDPFGKAFRALHRKVELRPEAKRAQRGGGANPP
jgi:NADPH-dependent 2,4-dienoyl-CoA reductase/sulfur reductase-like enzyme